MGRKYTAKADANQPGIVKRFREWGASVLHAHMIGGGAPDIIVGYEGINHLIEIKDGSKPKSAQKLTPDEVIFHSAWRGMVNIITSDDDVDSFMRSLRESGL